MRWNCAQVQYFYSATFQRWVYSHTYGGSRRACIDANMVTHTHTRKVTVNKRSIYHHCHKSDAGSGSSIWLRPILAQEREISCLFLLSMLPIWFPITSNSNQQQRRGDLRECVCMRREEMRDREREREREGERKREGDGGRDRGRRAREQKERGGRRTAERDSRTARDARWERERERE